MLLTFIERIHLLVLLPSEGNILNLRLIRTLQDQLLASSEEIEKYKIETEISNGQTMYKWPNEIPSKEIEVDNPTKALICLQLQSLSEQGKLKNEQVSLYEKFVENKE